MSAALSEWSEFNVAMAGATAALAGLVIVAASVNIERIIGSRALTSRLGSAITTLLLALVVSAVALMPDISLFWYGVVTVVSTVVAGGFAVHVASALASDSSLSALARFGKASVGFLPIAAYLAAGIALLAESTAGLPLAAIGCLLAIIAAVTISWIVLVEVLR